jgi:Protein of unknown function (DUF3305)
MSTFTMPVGVVIERRNAHSPWQDYVWSAHAVLPDVPDVAAGTSLGKVDDGDLFYAGSLNLEAHTYETPQYRDNFMSGKPQLWVVIRPKGDDVIPELVQVTCDPAEGEGYSEPGWDTVNIVPMPEAIQAALMLFIEEHHVEREVYKRKRKKADPEALGKFRNGPENDRAIRQANLSTSTPKGEL